MRAPLLVRALDTAMDRSFVLGYTSIGLRVRRALPGWPADPPKNALEGTDVLVTGASSGLGIASVEALAELGATVHLVVRDVAKGEGVRADIERRLPQARLQVWCCDVGDLEDVRRFAAEILGQLSSIHAVVHNAGVMPPERTESAQGHELSLAVHLLGPVVMTEALRPALQGGRVVLVSSGGAYGQTLAADDPGYTHGVYSPTTAYARSKRWQLEMLPRLAQRWSADAITTSVMHPGWADTPGVQQSLPQFRTITRPVLRDDAQGADTTVWLVGTDPPPTSGLFWHDRRARPINVVRSTRATRHAVDTAWAWLCRTVGLDTGSA